MKIEVANFLKAAELLEVDPGLLAQGLAAVSALGDKKPVRSAQPPKPQPKASKKKPKATYSKKKNAKVRSLPKRWSLTDQGDRKELEALIIESLKRAKDAQKSGEIMAYVENKSGRIPTADQFRTVLNDLIGVGKIRRQGERALSVYMAA